MSKENKPPKKNHPYYGTRYSVAVLGWDNEGNLILNLVCWDYRTGGWVQADLRDGPSSCDYELEVAKWMLPPEMPNTERHTRRESEVTDGKKSKKASDTTAARRCVGALVRDLIAAACSTLQHDTDVLDGTHDYEIYSRKALESDFRRVLQKHGVISNT